MEIFGICMEEGCHAMAKIFTGGVLGANLIESLFGEAPCLGPAFCCGPPVQVLEWISPIAWAKSCAILFGK